MSGNSSTDSDNATSRWRSISSYTTSMSFVLGISYAVNKEHYRPLMTRQTFHVKNTMIHGPEIIDYSIVPDDLSQYDSLIGGGFDE